MASCLRITIDGRGHFRTFYFIDLIIELGTCFTFLLVAIANPLCDLRVKCTNNLNKCNRVLLKCRSVVQTDICGFL